MIRWTLVVLAVFIASPLASSQTTGPATAPASRPAWTAETIAADPSAYLGQMEDQAKAALAALKASAVNAAETQAQFGKMIDKSKATIDTGEKVIDELIAAYQTAAADNSWPVKWNGRSIDRAAAENQVLSLHRQVFVQKTILAKTSQAMNLLQVYQLKATKARDDAKALLVEIAVQRELAKVQQVNAETAEKLVQVQPRIETLAGAAEQPFLVSIDQLAAPARAADDMTFEQIRAARKRK